MSASVASGVWSGDSSFWSLEGRIHFLPFPAWKSCLYDLGCGLAFLCVLFPHNLLLFCTQISLHVPLTWTLVITLRTWVKSAYSSHLKILI